MLLFLIGAVLRFYLLVSFFFVPFALSIFVAGLFFFSRKKEIIIARQLHECNYMDDNLCQIICPNLLSNEIDAINDEICMIKC